MSTIRKIGMLLALILSATVTVGASQPTDVPAAEKQFHAWLTVFNGGDRAALQEFLRKNNPDRADHVDDELRFREMTGGFEFKKTEESAPTKYVALLKERDSDTFVRAIAEVEEAAPHKIKGLQILATATPTEFQVAPMTEHDAIAAVKKLAEEQTASDKFSGSVAISKNGKTVFEQAYGWQTARKKHPIHCKRGSAWAL